MSPMSCVAQRRNGSPGMEYIQQKDLTKAARKVSEAKKHKSECHFYGAYVSSSLLSFYSLHCTDNQRQNFGHIVLVRMRV